MRMTRILTMMAKMTMLLMMMTTMMSMMMKATTTMMVVVMVLEVKYINMRAWKLKRKSRRLPLEPVKLQTPLRPGTDTINRNKKPQKSRKPP